MNKNRLMKIIIPVLIIVIILIIWVVKNDSLSTNMTTTPTENVGSESIVTLEKEEAFVLESKEIDMEALQTYKLPIVIDFGADSCDACKEIAPVLKMLNSEMQGKAIIKFVDVWKYPDAVGDFPIQLIPTQVLFTADGKPYTPSEDLGIEFTMYSTEDTNEHVFTIHQGGLTEEQMRAILADMGVE